MEAVIKVFLQETGAPDEVRRISVSTSGPGNKGIFKETVAKVGSTFPGLADKVFTFKWKDSDGDLVTISSDEELSEALGQSQDNPLNIFITVEGVKEASSVNVEADASQETSSDNVEADASQETSSDNVEADASQETSSENVEADASQETSSDNVEADASQETSSENVEADASQETSTNDKKERDHQREVPTEEDFRSGFCDPLSFFGMRKRGHPDSHNPRGGHFGSMGPRGRHFDHMGSRGSHFGHMGPRGHHFENMDPRGQFFGHLGPRGHHSESMSRRGRSGPRGTPTRGRGISHHPYQFSLVLKNV